MDRRIFLSLALAGCATPPMRAAVAQEPGTAPPPAAAEFYLWLSDFRGKALAAGLPPRVVDRELNGLTPNPRIVQLDGAQPEFSKPIGDYIKGQFSEARLAQGRRFRTELTFLPGVEQRFGVNRDILLAIWAMESAFGAIQGDFDVVRSMATLAADGRRRAWAEGQLIAALKILAAGDISREKLKGSWAGAMGQTQFFPQTYLDRAVDADGDGHIDIWASRADALGSAANLLSASGWERGGDWAREVILPARFDYGLTEGPRWRPDAWEGRGVRRADGRPWIATQASAEAQLVVPMGARGPAFLLFPNHFVIRKYNNSLAYALAIGMLADAFLGRPGIVQAWPTEPPMSLADRIAAQQALARAGFDPGQPDGVIGSGTRAALRRWQAARALPADGYLSAELVRRLKAEP
ncbi:MAG: lytic murein transglycosylase [Caulobacteraceae bacterium]|nr:lytic murein transglycosylase [Caulobacteraceae bacterium]